MTDSFREISTARQALRDSYQNLQNVADYCEKNYMEAPDKQLALKNTMALVTQTLASVACQVGAAAQHMSDMLEKESQKLQQEEKKVRIISQLLDIHAEKVSRQKIGSLTTPKKFKHTEKIVLHECQREKPLASYTRVPINFTSLDTTGHGTMELDSQLSKTGTMFKKLSVRSMSQTSTLSRRSFRVKDPVVPPLIPDQTFSCPLILNGFSSSLPNMNGDLSLPSPPELSEHFRSLAHSSIENDAHFPLCTYTENIDDLPPPPAFDLGITGSQFPECTYTHNNDDSLPPPPAPDYEIREALWPSENAPDLCVYPYSLDDLPPPPDC